MQGGQVKQTKLVFATAKEDDKVAWMAAFNAAVASVAEEESDEEAPPEIELVELAKDASELERLEVTGERGGGGLRCEK